jgi:hypothetical protein
MRRFFSPIILAFLFILYTPVFSGCGKAGDVIINGETDSLSIGMHAAIAGFNESVSICKPSHQVSNLKSVNLDVK